MKKTIVAVLLMAFITAFATSCATQNRMGCPTTDKRYFYK